MTERIRTLVRITALTWRSDPLRATAAAALTTVQFASPAVGAIAVRQLVQGVVEDSTPTGGALLLLGTVAVNQAAGFAGFVIRAGLTERVTHRLELELVRLVAGRPGIDHLEDPVALDRITLLRDSTGNLAGLTESVLTAFGVAARLIATVALLAIVDLRLAGLAVCGLPAIGAGPLSERIQDRRDAERTPHMRRAAVLHFLTKSPSSAAELRLAGARDDIGRRLHDDRRAVDRIIRRSNLAMTAVGNIAFTIFGAGLLATLLLLSSRAQAGEIQAGEVAMVVTLAAQLEGQVGALADWLTGLLDMLRAAGHHDWLNELARTPARTEEAPVTPQPIVLDRVSFTYPGTVREVLHQIDLTLPPGRTVAIVGENGSGKSTLVKLLTGMHEPTHGSIWVGDRRLREIDPKLWRTHLSAAFQDAAAFEVAARHAVGLGDLMRVDDESAVLRAMVRADAADLVAGLPAGLDTPLGRSFDGGVQLSGGQWQRLAIARAAMREHPFVLVLDEPSANLDPAAEHDLFRRLLALGRSDTDRPAGLTLFVTHRLSTAARADHIILMANGSVVEQGNHATLLHGGGQYADLYHLQADGYR